MLSTKKAELTPIKLSFWQAFLLGLSGGHVTAARNNLRYNGAGLNGDKRALALDMLRSLK